MSEPISPIEEEINAAQTLISGWISHISSLTPPASMKDVVSRFIRDCETHKNDLVSKESPSSSDMVDYSARTESLRIQYHYHLDNLG